MLLLGVLVIIILQWIWWRVRNKELLQLSKQTQIDYPAWPFIGHLYLMLGNAFDRMKTVCLLGIKCNSYGGLISAWLGSYFILVVTDPDSIDVISKNCLDKPEVLSFMKDLFGNGSILAPVPIWRPRRKAMAPIFSNKNLNLFVDVFSQKSRILVEQLKTVAGNGVFPFWQYITTYSMSAVCETTLGCPVVLENEKRSSFLNSFETTTEIGVQLLMSPWLRPRFIMRHLKMYKTFLGCRKIMYDFIDNIIALKRKTLKNKSSGHNSVLEMLMDAGDSTGFTDVELREETLAMALAGTDTSAISISYTCILLSQHPDIQEKVYNELREVLGDSERAVTAPDLPRLKYLEAVIKESLRLYPPIPAVLRTVTQRVTLPSGVTLVPGCVVVLHIWGTHRHPRHWGADAELFRPERFLEDTQRHPAAFLAFSHAHRNCLGYQYAMMSMKTAVATLVRNYRILPAVEPDREGNYPPLNIEYKILMRDADKFKFKLEFRK